MQDDNKSEPKLRQETATPDHQLQLGYDGEGKILTDERRAERAQELNELAQEASMLRRRLADIMAEIARKSTSHYPAKPTPHDSQS